MKNLFFLLALNKSILVAFEICQLPSGNGSHHRSRAGDHRAPAASTDRTQGNRQLGLGGLIDGCKDANNR
jgi:hypothetical protein